MPLEMQDLEQLENRMEKMLKPVLESLDKQMASVVKSVEESTTRQSAHAEKLYDLDRQRQKEMSEMRTSMTTETEEKIKNAKDEVIGLIDKGRVATTTWIGIALAAGGTAVALGIFK